MYGTPMGMFSDSARLLNRVPEQQGASDRRYTGVVAGVPKNSGNVPSVPRVSEISEVRIQELN
jgi:hypothetical protein